MRKIALAILLLLLGVSSQAKAEVVVVRSGSDANIDGLDDHVHFLAATGPSTSPSVLIPFLNNPNDLSKTGAFANSFEQANFTQTGLNAFQGAQAGSQAFLTGPTGSLPTQLNQDSQSGWISSTPNAGDGTTAVYAIKFELQNFFNHAYLTLNFVSDDVLGGLGGPNVGVYVNGVALSDTNGIGDAAAETVYYKEISKIAKVGENWLYINVSNQGGMAGFGGKAHPTGVMFRAEILTHTPEPSSFVFAALVGAGALIGGLRARRAKRRPNS